MNAYHESIQYVISKVIQARDDKEYPATHDISDIIHEELDYYCSTLYNGECDEIIVSYGLTKALVEYDNQFGECPKTSQGLLYVIMMDVVREGVEKEEKRIEEESDEESDEDDDDDESEDKCIALIRSYEKVLKDIYTAMKTPKNEYDNQSDEDSIWYEHPHPILVARPKKDSDNESAKWFYIGFAYNDDGHQLYLVDDRQAPLKSITLPKGRLTQKGIEKIVFALFTRCEKEVSKHNAWVRGWLAKK